MMTWRTPQHDPIYLLWSVVGLYSSCKLAAVRVLVTVISSLQSFRLCTPTFTTMSFMEARVARRSMQWAAGNKTKYRIFIIVIPHFFRHFLFLLKWLIVWFIQPGVKILTIRWLLTWLYVALSTSVWYTGSLTMIFIDVTHTPVCYREFSNNRSQ